MRSGSVPHKSRATRLPASAAINHLADTAPLVAIKPISVMGSSSLSSSAMRASNGCQSPWVKPRYTADTALVKRASSGASTSTKGCLTPALAASFAA